MNGRTPDEVAKLAAVTTAEAVDYLADYEAIDVSHLSDFEGPDFRTVYAAMIREWMGFEGVDDVLKGEFPTLGVFA